MDGGDGGILGENPQIVVNGFIKAGIAGALDGHIEEEANMREDESDSEEYDSDPDDDSSVMDLTGEDDY